MKEKDLNRAIYHAVMMWSDSHYERFLFRKKPGRLDEDEGMFDWFKWFVNDWRVERTIKEGKRNFVRRYLDGNFRIRLAGGLEGSAVEKVAQIIKEKGWGAKESKNGNGPQSLVSKIGFFLKPETLVPMDRFAREGLKKLRKRRRLPSLKLDRYSEYLEAFNTEFKFAKNQICHASSESWVTALSKKLGCHDIKAARKSPAFQRKIFDTYLMEIGGR
jgi:hypothetical protein